MASRPVQPVLLLLLAVVVLVPAAHSQLTLDYYKKSCPRFSQIIQEVVVDKQLAFPATAAGALRVFFHDCIVGGCDASLLISSNSFNNAERDSAINLALPGDAFDVITRAKTKLELECPGIASCADILAEATRDLISMVGGPYYPVRLGRRDSPVSRAQDVEGHIALPNMTMNQIIDTFAKKGYSIQEMVALVGSHTIGFSHCGEFSNRIFQPNGSPKQDPTMNPTYADGLRKLCANYKKDPSIAAFNDPITPGKFDNMYFLNLQKGVGLLASDQLMLADPRTKPFVETYAANQSAFFDAFAKAIEKVSEHNVLTGNKGEVRKRCDAANSIAI